MANEIEYRVNGGFLDIPELDFFGQCNTSRNGKYALGWADRVILLKHGESPKVFDLVSPEEGNVADNGNFVIASDVQPEKLSSVLNAYSPEGELLIRLKVRALLVNNGISPSGYYAVWQTANNPDSTDGNTLIFFDLIKRKSSWAVPPEPGWASHYEFDDANQILNLLYRAGQSYRYSYAGEFLDAEKLETNLLNSNLPYEVLRAVEDKLGSGTITTAEHPKLIGYLEAALSKRPEPDTKSSIYRWLGEMHYALKDRAKAVDYLEKALELNPKVGAKRLLGKIKKEMN